MNKKIFGIKISTLLVAVVCLIVAVMIWMFVQYNMDMELEEHVSSYISGKVLL